MGNDEQRDFWDDRAAAWDEQAEWMDSAQSEHAASALRALAAQPGERVIDLGCGAGLSAVALGRAVGASGWVAAVDLSSRMAEAAGRRLASAGVSGSATAADVQSDDLVSAAGEGQPFDAAHSRHGVMFFDDPDAAFANIARCLRPGGRLAVSVWQDLGANDWMSVPTLTALGPLGVDTLPLPEPGRPGPFSLADPDHVREVVDRAGFVDVEVAPVDGPFRVRGDLRPGIVQMLRAGPLNEAYDAADEATRTAAVDAVYTALDPYRVADGFDIPAASWCVTAHVP
jgi:SAM-dependent methyltransferase